MAAPFSFGTPVAPADSGFGFSAPNPTASHTPIFTGALDLRNADIKKLEKIIKEKDATIKDKDELLEESKRREDHLVIEAKAQNRTAATAIELSNKHLKDRNNAFAIGEKLLERRNRNRRQRREAERGEEKALWQRDLLIQERDDVFDAQDAAIEEKDAAIKEKDAAIKDRDQAVAAAAKATENAVTATREKDAAIEERNKALVAQGKALKDIDAAAKKYNTALEAKRSADQDRDQAFKKCKQALEAQRIAEEEREKIVKNRKEAWEAKRKADKERDQAVKDGKAAAKATRKATEDRDKAVKDRIDAVELARKAIEDQNQAIEERDRAVTARIDAVELARKATEDQVQAVKDRDQAIQDRDQAVKDRDQAVKDREEAVQATDNMSESPQTRINIPPEDEIRILKAEAARVEKNFVELESHCADLEDQLATKVTSIEEDKRNNAVLKASLDEANREIATLQEERDAVMEERNDGDETIQDQATSITNLTIKLNRANLDWAKDRKKILVYEQEAAIAQSDLAGISSLLAQKGKQLDDLEKHLQTMQDQAEDQEDELYTAVETIAAYETEAIKLEEDSQYKSFDTDPTAHTQPIIVTADPVEDIKPQATLEDELESVGYDTNSEGTDSRTASEERSRPNSPDTVAAVVSALPDTFADDETPFSTDEQILDPSGDDRAQPATRDGYHPSFSCWLMDTRDLFVLFSIWVLYLAGGVSVLLGARFGFLHLFPPAVRADPPSDDLDAPTHRKRENSRLSSANTIRDQQEKSLYEAAESLEPVDVPSDNREVIGDLVTPISPSAFEMPGIFPAVTQKPVAKSPGNLPSGKVRRRAPGTPRTFRDRVTNPLPHEIPSVKITLLNNAWHLLVLYCVYRGISAYFEHKLWLDANDHTRQYVFQQLHNPRSFRSGIEKLLGPFLSESQRRSLGIFIFKNVVEQFGLERSYNMPG